jgi:hypothetical protein
MARKRPCRICKKWFRPHPRAGLRQRVCSSPECQRERHRRACAAWRRRNPDYERADRLRQRLRSELPETAEAPLAACPVHRLHWPAARDAVGLQVVVVIREAVRVLWEWTQDAVAAQLHGREGVSS